MEAILSKWCMRKWRKIGPKEIVMAYLSVLLSAGGSYSQLSRAVGIAQRITVSKQAVHKRTNKRLVAYFNNLVSKSLLNGMRDLPRKRGGCGDLFASFGSVLLQDSTCVGLPDALAEHFPGAWNGRGNRKAMLKIDTVLDIKHWVLRRLVVNPYTVNDQSQACPALDSVGEGMLVIRDLGYFTTMAFAETADKRAFFLSRLQYGVKIYDIESGQEVCLDKLLREGRSLDRWFLLSGQRVPVRLVAAPLPAAIADERRRKATAKAAGDSRVNHSADYIHRLGWTILVTNVKEDTWDSRQVAQAYGYRWFVETLFKSWKSHFNLASQPCPKKSQAPYKREPKHPYKAEAMVLAFLLLVVMVQMPLMEHFLVTNPPKKGEPAVSMLKMTRLIADHYIHATAADMEFIVESIPYFCKYDKRKRPNAASKIVPQTV
jgi:hypothetical protein